MCFYSMISLQFLNPFLLHQKVKSMKHACARLPLLIALTLITAMPLPGADKTDKQEQPPEQPAVHFDWQKGPQTVKLGDNAELDLPAGYLFVDGEGARKFADLTHNLSSGREVGLIVPASKDESWFIVFEFDPTGYVKDEEKNSLDADAIFKSIHDATENANDEKKKRGWEAFHINNWYRPPYYDNDSHNLTWALNGSGDNGADPAINYSVRILGRKGTMDVDLVLAPKEIGTAEPQFKMLMSKFHYTAGDRYTDYVKGDKLAEYGLTALIVGGAGAVAAKTGLLAKFWKVIVTIFAAIWKLLVVAFAAVASFFKKIWNSLFGRKEERIGVENNTDAGIISSDQHHDAKFNSGDESGNAGS